MSDFDFRRPPSNHEPVDAEPPASSPPPGTDATAWSPDAPIRLPANGRLPGLLMTGGTDHAEMVSRTQPAPNLIDFDVQALEAEQQVAKMPSPLGHGPRQSVYEDMKAGRGDASAPEPTGRMMQGLDQYAAETRSLDKNWSHQDPNATADDLRQAMNKMLARDHVPGLRPNEPNDKDEAAASFSAQDWAEKISPKPFQSASDVDTLAGNILHEGTHADQHFAAARYEAAQHPDASADELGLRGMRPKITQQAVGLERSHEHPMTAAETASSEQMANTLVDNRDETYAIEGGVRGVDDRGNRAFDTYQQMGSDDRTLASGTWNDLRGKLVQANDQYYQLPNEQGAFAVEKKLKDKLSKDK